VTKVKSVLYRKTPDGSMYPLFMPWGNMGTIMNGLCLNAVYQRIAFDKPASPPMKASRCFMHQQMGYIFNHKCDRTGESCSTPTTAGFAYQVGCGPEILLLKEPSK
jgi:hypothetical protein